ncbi:uncharacterized protein LOC113561641 [Ooceraea biroi]|uniref:uncharacterized protein LOC113561641 n=1 Tax=Ooceraea biroi TaxID=2015173 RepID=UPI000F08EA61|nr:uncharacterized protein LOC113561641 [Ooceraea biroi]
MVRRNKHRAGRRKRERIEYLLQLRRAQFSDFLRNLDDQPPSRSVSPDKRQSEETATPDPSTLTQETSSSQLPSHCSESSPQVTEYTSSPEESHASTVKVFVKENQPVDSTGDSDIEFIEEIEVISKPPCDPIINAYFMKIEKLVRITLTDSTTNTSVTHEFPDEMESEFE